MPWTIRISKLRIHNGFWLLLLLAVRFDFWQELTAVYLFAALHEGAHMLTARLCGIGIEEIEILPFGLCGKLQGETVRNCRHDILIAAAGPTVNLLLLVLLHQYPLWATANLVMLLLNLMPALPLDGGRICRAVLVERCGCLHAQHLMRTVTLITAGILTAAGVVILIITRCNFSLLLIGCFAVTGWLAEERAGQTVYLRELLYSRSRLEREGSERSYLLTLEQHQPARLALSYISYNRYTWILVADKQGHLLGTISETGLIRSLLEAGSQITAAEALRREGSLDKKRQMW